MIRMAKLTDYGIVLLTHFAKHSQNVFKARDLAKAASLPLPTVAKILKHLTRSGLLISQRGMKGGYCLARNPSEISVAQIIDLLEGPITLADCTDQSQVRCGQESCCPVSHHWNGINEMVRETLEKITLAEMSFSQQHNRQKIAVSEETVDRGDSGLIVERQ